MILDFSKEETLQAFNSYTENWQKEIVSFVKLYLDKTKEIQVQTSGSTGKPKTIFIPKKFMKNSALMTGTYFNLEKGLTALLCLPIHYIAGKMMVVRAIELQLKLFCVEPSSNPLGNLKSTTIDFCAMVPLQVENSINQLPLIKQLIIGGAPVSTQLETKIEHLPTLCFATYGMTETVTHIAIKPLNHILKSSFFTILNTVSIDTDSRNCLVINCPLLSDSIITTNDVVKLKDTTQFKFLGRYDHVINSGGIKIHPEIIEKKLSPLLSNRFFITSIPDEKLGEKVILIIENETGVSLNFDSFLDRFEIPKEVYTISNFVETPTGKINRRKTMKLVF